MRGSFSIYKGQGVLPYDPPPKPKAGEINWSFLYPDYIYPNEIKIPVPYPLALSVIITLTGTGMVILSKKD